MNFKKNYINQIFESIYVPMYIVCGAAYAAIVYSVYPFLHEMRAFHAFRLLEHNAEHVLFSSFLVLSALFCASFVRHVVYRVFNSAFLFSVIIPSMVLYPYFDPDLIYEAELFAFLFSSILLSIVGYFAGDKKTFLLPFYLNRKSFIYVIGFVSLANIAIIFITFRDIFSISSFIDVYTQRFLYRSNVNIVSYLIHWQMMVFSPFCVFIGMVRKVYFLTWIGVAGAVVVYGITAFKMAPAIVVVIFIALYLDKIRFSINMLLFVPFIFLVIICASIFIDFFILDTPILIYFIVDRNMVGTGIIQLMTIETFRDLPHALWSNSFLRLFVDPLYDTDPFIITGLYFFEREVRVNSGFIADGYINGGLWGIMLSACIASISIYVTTLVYNGLPKIFTVALLPFVLSMINGPVQVTLLTNGLFLFWVVALLYKNAFDTA
jgi:hypothetical protein